MAPTAQPDERIPGSRSATGPERLLPRGRRHDLTREFVSRTQRDRLIDAMARTAAERAVGHEREPAGDGGGAEPGQHAETAPAGAPVPAWWWVWQSQPGEAR